MSKRIDRRKAWLERVKQARIVRERKRWERRTARWSKPKPAEGKAEAKPEAKKEEKTEVPPALFAE